MYLTKPTPEQCQQVVQTLKERNGQKHSIYLYYSCVESCCILLQSLNYIGSGTPLVMGTANKTQSASLSSAVYCRLIQHSKSFKSDSVPLNTKEVQMLCEAIMSNTHTVLQDLSIVIDNCINNESAKHLGQLLQRNTSLQILSLYSCRNLGDEGVHQICTALKHNHTLLSLNLSLNTFTNCGVHHLAHMLKKNKSLQTLTLLHLPCVLIHQDAVIELFEAMTENSTLDKLVLTGTDDNKHTYTTFHKHEKIKNRVTFTCN